METKFDFINNVIKTTLITGFVCLVAACLFSQFYEGIALFLGTLWGAINLYFLKNVMQSLLLPKAKNHTKSFILISIKWPLLYLAGFGLLKIKELPPVFLLIGFSLIFAVIVVLALINTLKRASAHE